MKSSNDWQFLRKLQLGEPLPLPSYGMTLVPILDPDPEPIEAFPLRWGIDQGRTRVTEIGDGRVNEIRVEHAGATPLLILDGEEVVGAKQNRVFNASFLVPPGETVALPVSCVEQRRWAHASEAFASSSRTVVTSVRSTKLRRVATSVITRGDYDAGQQEVWTGVSRYIERTQVTSKTASHAEAADTRRHAIELTLRTIQLAAGQVGVASVSTQGHVTVDVLGSPGLLNKTWWVIARGLLGDENHGRPPMDAVQRTRACLDELAMTTPHRKPAPGIGESLHVVGAHHVAGAIAYRDRIYHLLATSVDEAP